MTITKKKKRVGMELLRILCKKAQKRTVVKQSKTLS